jgi:hypothetical protein
MHLYLNEILIDLFYVTSCNITFLEYAENICKCDGTGIFYTGDRSTFVPPPGSDIKEVWV